MFLRRGCPDFISMSTKSSTKIKFSLVLSGVKWTLDHKDAHKKSKEAISVEYSHAARPCYRANNKFSFFTGI